MNKYGDWRIESENEHGKIKVAPGDNVRACIFVTGAHDVAYAYMLKSSPRLYETLEKIIEMTKTPNSNNVDASIHAATLLKNIQDIAQGELNRIVTEASNHYSQ